MDIDVEADASEAELVGPTPRSATPAQSAASRSNGAKSRGPLTPGGKAMSRMNSLKHGVYAKTLPMNSYSRYLSKDRVEQLSEALSRDLGDGSASARIFSELLAVDICRLQLLQAAAISVASSHDTPAPVIDLADQTTAPPNNAEKMLSALETARHQFLDQRPMTKIPPEFVNVVNVIWDTINDYPNEIIARAQQNKADLEARLKQPDISQESRELDRSTIEHITRSTTEMQNTLADREKIYGASTRSHLFLILRGCKKISVDQGNRLAAILEPKIMQFRGAVAEGQVRGDAEINQAAIRIIGDSHDVRPERLDRLMAAVDTGISKKLGWLMALRAFPKH